MVNSVEIGKRIREFRLKAGLTQEKLASLLEITFQQVQKYERGITKVNLDRLQELASILNVPISAFFNEQDTTAYNLTENERKLLEAFREIKSESTRNSFLHIANKLKK